MNTDETRIKAKTDSSVQIQTAPTVCIQCCLLSDPCFIRVHPWPLLMIEQELGAIQHRPRQVLRGLAAVRALLQVGGGEPPLTVRRWAAEERQVQLLDQ